MSTASKFQKMSITLWSTKVLVKKYLVKRSFWTTFLTINSFWQIFCAEFFLPPKMRVKNFQPKVISVGGVQPPLSKLKFLCCTFLCWFLSKMHFYNHQAKRDVLYLMFTFVSYPMQHLLLHEHCSDKQNEKWKARGLIIVFLIVHCPCFNRLIPPSVILTQTSANRSYVIASTTTSIPLISLVAPLNLQSGSTVLLYGCWIRC